MCMQLRRGSWMLQLRPPLLTVRATLIVAARMRPASVIDSTTPRVCLLQAATADLLIAKKGREWQSNSKAQHTGERD